MGTTAKYSPKGPAGPTGPISEITSTGGTIIVTDSTGPTVNVEVSPSASAVTSVFGRTGGVIANTGDYDVAEVTGAAPLDSPTFTGVPAAPTAAAGTATTQIATTAFVTTATASYLPLAGGTMSGAIAMGAHKITGLADGTAATDAAAFGQIPVPADGYGITGNTGATPTPAVDLTTVESFIGANVALGANVQVTSVVLAAGTWDITARLDVFNNSGSVATYVEAAIGPNSASYTGAYAGTSFQIPGGGQVGLTIVKSVTLATQTTVYLNATSTAGASSAEATWETTTSSIPNVTGITAVRTA